MKTRKKTPRSRTARRSRRSPAPDAGMSRDEKESLIEQVEEFEGPDRREKRGTPAKTPREPGVARS